MHRNLFKKTKLSTFGNYSSSSNLETPIEVLETNTPSQIPCLIEQKAAKRKIRRKKAYSFTPINCGLSCYGRDNEGKKCKNKLAEAVESDNINKLYDILMKSTTNMTKVERNIHEITCNYILKKFSSYFSCLKLLLITCILKFVFNYVSFYVLSYQSLCCNTILIS